MKTISKLKKIILIMILVLLVVIGVYTFLVVLPNKNKNNTENEIEDYGYKLYERDSDLYEEKFKELKTILKDDINYEEYAKHVSELFIIDLYSLNNKKSELDVTAVQYMYPDVLDNFKSKVSDTLYRYIGLNKELPKVISINTSDITKDSYKLNDKEYTSYNVTMDWDYETDYGYDKKGVVTLIEDNNKLYIVKLEVLNEQTN